VTRRISPRDSRAQPAPGQVVIGASTAEAIAGDAVVEALEPLHLKGKSEPVSAFVVLRLV
jgi:class 3 adenylate cyclase